MKARFANGLLFGLSAAACGGDPGGEPAAPPVYAIPPGPAFVPGLSPNAVSSGTLPVTGHLDGSLRGIQLSGNTTDNTGGYEVWERGGGYLQLQIASAGSPSGAGMLLVGFTGLALEEALSSGYWSSATAAAESPSAIIVSSCAGPTIGDWPFELAATDAEMNVAEDPERPEGVVLVVKGRFPAAHLGESATSALTGTFRFDRPEMTP